MSEFIVAFELITVVYILVLVPVLVFLIVLAYRFAEKLWEAISEKSNRAIVNRNRQVIMDNIRASRELINVQEELRRELELTKKALEED